MLSDFEKQQAEGVRQEFQAACNAVRGSRRSPGEKRQLIAYAKVQADAKIAAIRAASEAREELTAEMLERQLFRNPGNGRTAGHDLIAMRDAADRARACETPDEMLGLLVDAERTGDTGQSRAIMREAFARSHSGQPLMANTWRGVVAGYIAANPGEEPAISELDDILTARNDHRARIQDEMHLGVPYPEELPHNDPAIALMARGETGSI